MPQYETINGISLKRYGHWEVADTGIILTDTVDGQCCLTIYMSLFANASTPGYIQQLAAFGIHNKTPFSSRYRGVDTIANMLNVTPQCRLVLGLYQVEDERFNSDRIFLQRQQGIGDWEFIQHGETPMSHVMTRVNGKQWATRAEALDALVAAHEAPLIEYGRGVFIRRR